MTETVAMVGRSKTVIYIAMGVDQRNRFGVSLSYSYGGFGFAPSADAESFATYANAIDAGIDALLARWHQPFASDPASVHEELCMLREQLVAGRNQPSLF